MFFCCDADASAFVVGVLGQMQGRPADVMILNAVPVFGLVIDVLYNHPLRVILEVWTGPDSSLRAL